VSQRRTLILVAAIAIGALSSFLVWNYVNGVEDEAFDNAEQVPVYLVKEAIPRGTDGRAAQAYIAEESIPRKFKPGNAITNPEDIAGLVARNDLVANQVVVSDMFVSASNPEARQSFSERLTRIRNEDMVTATVEVDQVHGVAHLVEPGDYVNIMALAVSQMDENGNPTGLPEGVDSGEVLFGESARYIYQKAEVLAVGRSSLPEAGETATAAAAEGEAAAEPVEGGLITFIVPARAAQLIASIEQQRIYLSMVAPDYRPVPQEPIDPSSPLPAEDTGALTPYGPKGPDSAE
jgi:Flp pilus assembly protein CpaB